MHNKTKDQFRKNCIKKLKFCSKIGKKNKDKKIIENLLKIIKNGRFKNILLYIPLNMEVNIFPLISVLRKKNYNVFVPYMIGETLKVVPFRLPLEKKRFNILEPRNSNLDKIIKIDLAVVPIVGIDNSMRRVGFGAGFYDRYFDSLKVKPKIIFTQVCLCKTKFILTESHDIKCDYIVTNKVIKWKI